jgi:hypothetical protein
MWTSHTPNAAQIRRPLPSPADAHSLLQKKHNKREEFTPKTRKPDAAIS